jgi:hypothetical protein
MPTALALLVIRCACRESTNARQALVLTRVTIARKVLFSPTLTTQPPRALSASPAQQDT